MKMQVQLLGESQLEKVFQDALRVWREVPFRVQGTDEFFDYLLDYGCQVDGELVSFPQAVIDKVLARLAEEKASRRRRNADGEADWPESELQTFTHGQALHICDLETNRLRPATEGDLVSWCHLVDSMGIKERTHPTFIPTDVPRGSADFHAFATIILNSRKPHRVSVYSAGMLPFFIEACKVAKGSLEEVKRDPVFATKCWANSPFMITRENIEIAMDARKLLGRPLTFGHMPVAGASGPITLAGSLVQNTAESLGLCAMRLAVDDLVHEIVGSSAIMDMRDACRRESGPDLELHSLAGSQMHAYLLGGRPGIGILGVAAQTVSPQSVYEKGMAAAFAIAAGQRKLGIGCLAFSDVGSPVQLALDHEMMLQFQHLFREVNLDDEHVGLETILETAKRGAFFLETDHTARFFREECWLPTFIDNRVPLAWMQDPSDMIDRARKHAEGLRNSATNQCSLPEHGRQEIRALLRDADAFSRNK